MLKALTMILMTLDFSSIVMASPGNPHAVCENFINSFDKLKCLEIVNNKHFEQEAINVCSSLISSFDKLECMRGIANKVFQLDALNVCSNMIQFSDKVLCMNTIANMTYNPQAVKICAGMLYAADKLTCLKQSAQPIDPCLTKAQMLETLKIIYNLVSTGSNYAARTQLVALMDHVQSCVR